jgi:hypothetical protein
LRFFDFWLKGIENEVMDESPVVYSTQISTKDRGGEKTWRFAPSWPPPGMTPTEFYFHEGRSGTVSSVNDGRLSTVMPEHLEGADEYVVDYEISEPPGDQHLRVGEPGADFRNYDERCLTYTSGPLIEPLEITGHPVVHLFISSSERDADFVVHLEDVDENGVSTYVDQRRMRASHRATRPAPYYRFEAPWHSYFESDAEPIPSGAIVEVPFELLPTSYLFRSAHRIRVSIACAEAATALTPILDPPPRIKIFRGPERSRIVLPVASNSSSGSIEIDEKRSGI